MVEELHVLPKLFNSDQKQDLSLYSNIMSANARMETRINDTKVFPRAAVDYPQQLNHVHIGAPLSQPVRNFKEMF